MLNGLSRLPEPRATACAAWLGPVLVACLAAGCGGDPRPDTDAPASDTAAEPTVSREAVEALRAGPNLLLVTLDTLRADHLGAYGYEAIDTPVVDRLAAEGVLFDQVATSVPITLPAHATILTGQYPQTHSVRDNGVFWLPEQSLTLAEVLRDAGYATGGFVGAFVLDARFGTGQGFGAYTDFSSEASESLWSVEAGGTPRPVSEIQRLGEEVVGEALDWLASTDGSFFAWVHLYDPHTPYEPPEPFASRYPGRPYDGEIAYTDHAVGLLLDGLEAAGHADDTLVVVVADHGEGLGDHGEQWHTFFVYDSTVRVPLILWAPGKLPAGRVVRSQASLVDLLPTVLGLLGIGDPAAERRDGIDLRTPMLTPEAAGRPVYVESMVPLVQFGWSELRGLRDERWKYISAPRPELYDLRADPGESNNLAGSDASRVADWQARLDDLVGGDDPGAVADSRRAMDPETIERLRSLGYLAGGGAPRTASNVDPKDKIRVFEAFNDGVDAVLEMMAEGRWSEAEEELRALDRVAPDHYIVQYYLGKVALEQGRAEEAIATLTRALELNAGYSLTYVELARAYEIVGQRQRGIELLGEAMRAYPDIFSFPLQLGYLHQRQHNFAEALAAYRVAHRMIPKQPRLLNRMANLYLVTGEPRQALETLQTLAELTPDDPFVWGNLGMVLGGLGRLEEAEAAFRQGVARAPDEPRMHYNLGLVLLRRGRSGEAADEFRRTLELDPSFEEARAQLARLRGQR